MTEQPLRLARYFEVFIEDQVMDGRFESPTAVIEEALRLLEAREARYAPVRRALQEGEESGCFGPLDMTEIKRSAREESGIAASIRA